MPETKQPERLAPRATSNRNGGRDHLGILGEIKSVHPGEIIGIRNYSASTAILADRLAFLNSAGTREKPVASRASEMFRQMMDHA
jgi:hypothetical protein